METLILISKNDFFDSIINQVGKLFYRYELYSDEQLRILNPESNSSVRIERIDFHHICDGTQIEVFDESFKFLAVYYSDIEFLKKIIVSLDLCDVWINNDFDDINYTFTDYIKKIEDLPDWDWRIR